MRSTLQLTARGRGLMLVAIAAALMASAADAQQQSASQSEPASVTREVDFDVSTLTSDPARQPALRLRLADHKLVEVVLDERTEQEGGRVSWRGHVAGGLPATVHLVAAGETITGLIDLSDQRKLLKLRSSGPGRARLVEVALPEPGATRSDRSNPSGATDARRGAVPVRSERRPPDAGRDAAASANETPISSQHVDTVVDVLVFYTAAARSAAGGVPSIQAEIQLHFDLANTAHSVSETGVRLQPIGIQELSNFLEADPICGDDYDTHLTKLSSRCRLSDPCFPCGNQGDAIFETRNSLGGDLVMLFLHDPGSTKGNGYQPGQYSVVQWDTTDRYTAAHEAGHNMSLCHNIEEDPTTCGFDGTTFNYARGYVITDPVLGLPDSVTIMAYEAVGVLTPRKNFFSDPDVSISFGFLGSSPGGNAATGDSQRRILETKLATSSIWPNDGTLSTVWVNASSYADQNFFSSNLLPVSYGDAASRPLKLLSQGVRAAANGATIEIAPGSYPAISINKPVLLKRSGTTGVVTIGQ